MEIIGLVERLKSTSGYHDYEMEAHGEIYESVTSGHNDLKEKLMERSTKSLHLATTSP